MASEHPNLLALGRAIELTRKQRHMSPHQLADASGVARERLDALEAGQLDPTYELLAKIADGLEAQPSGLVILAELIDNSQSL